MRKEVECPVCGAMVKTTQALSGHIRFRHQGAQPGRRELTDLEFEWLLHLYKKYRFKDAEFEALVGMATGKKHSPAYLLQLLKY